MLGWNRRVARAAAARQAGRSDDECEELPQGFRSTDERGALERAVFLPVARYAADDVVVGRVVDREPALGADESVECLDERV
jgi:hypothetical protein